MNYCKIHSMYDSIIIGGGPAGLSAAIYLGRFNRNILVIENGFGRSNYHQLNENYLGFPEGIYALQLKELGKKQAERFGAHFVHGMVEELKKDKQLFSVRTDKTIYTAKTLIIATGVTDKFPLFDNYEDCVGVSLFWCITCDGHKTQGKKVIVVGKDNQAAVTCMQFLNYTKNLIFLSNYDETQVCIEEKYLKRLTDASIPILYGCIQNVEVENGFINKIFLDNGEVLTTDFLFSMQGAVPNSYVSKQIGVEKNEEGYIKVDLEQRTNVPLVYAAGDVTNHFSHQVVTAVHQGSMAAQAANYDLYLPEQKE